MNNPAFNIAAVERDTGLSKDVLRMWERRYGFPMPLRDAHGERLYSAEQVDRLRLIKRLMDQGHRPGKLLAMPDAALAELGPRRPRATAEAEGVDRADLDELISLIRHNDSAGYRQAMHQRLARQGLLRFVQDTVAPLTTRIGEAWEKGEIEVFEEHLFTELTKRILRQAIASLPAGNGPRILLTSLPDEPHVLGLLMVEALFALEGADCIPLGTQMPLLEIGRAVGAHRADIVALSFSVAFPTRQIAPLLRQLRLVVPESVEIWVGGEGVRRVEVPPGIRLLCDLSVAIAALEDRRRAA